MARSASQSNDAPNRKAAGRRGRPTAERIVAIDLAIKAAALDVFPDEPNVSEALLALPNVVVEPHIASTTEETRRAIGALVFANVKAHFSGAPLPSPVT